jgi:cytochrome c oxidase subunit 4
MLIYAIGWLILLVLLGLEIGSAFLHLGAPGPAVQFGVAATQAAIVFILFMRLRGGASLKWIFAGAGFFWLLLLYGLSATDYATRLGFPTQP